MSEVYKSSTTKGGDAEFFCENCKNPVSTAEATCPHCGAVFSGVKCPRCNYSGTMDLFITGCPRCGYVRDSRTIRNKPSLFNLSQGAFWGLIFFFLAAALTLGFLYESLW